MTFNLFPLSVRRKFCQYIEYSFWVCTSGHKIGIDLRRVTQQRVNT